MHVPCEAPVPKTKLPLSQAICTSSLCWPLSCTCHSPRICLSPVLLKQKGFILCLLLTDASCVSHPQVQGTPRLFFLVVCSARGLPCGLWKSSLLQLLTVSLMTQLQMLPYPHLLQPIGPCTFTVFVAIVISSTLQSSCPGCLLPIASGKPEPPLFYSPLLLSIFQLTFSVALSIPGLLSLTPFSHNSWVNIRLVASLSCVYVPPFSIHLQSHLRVETRVYARGAFSWCRLKGWVYNLWPKELCWSQMSQTIYINYLRLRANGLYVSSVFKSLSTTHEDLLSNHTITKLYEMERIWKLPTARCNGIWHPIQIDPRLEHCQVGLMVVRS